MKSYTDLEQSKKLVKILPLESADMAWYPSYAKEGYSIRMLNDTYPLDIIGEEHDEIPAWSLAALLEQLDDNITNDDGNDLMLEIHKEDGLYYLNYHDRWEWQDDIETDYYDDLVDACYEMILKLHELNLL